MGSETLSFTPLKVSVFFIFFSPLPILSLCLSLLDLSHLSHCASHARSLPLSSLVSQSRSSPAFQRLAAFPVLLLAGNRSTRRIVVARHLLVSSNRRHESPWIVDCCRIFTCFVAHPLLGSGPLRHPVALGLLTDYLILPSLLNDYLIFLKFPYKFWPSGSEKEFFIYAHE